MTLPTSTSGDARHSVASEVAQQHNHEQETSFKGLIEAHFIC